jgi:hypothetical protein
MADLYVTTPSLVIRSLALGGGVRLGGVQAKAVQAQLQWAPKLDWRVLPAGDQTRKY